LDPEAERWASRFETVPPPEDPAAAPPAPAVPAAAAPPTVEEPQRKKGRWKTQVMGSMVPLEVSLAREERAPLSEEAPHRPLSEPPPIVVAAQAAAQAPTPSASTLIQHDVPTGWRLPVDVETPEIAALRDAVLAHKASRRVCIVTTGASGARRAQVAAALAFSLTQRGARVLLAEGDFDGPELHQVLDISPPPGSGFSQQLGARRQGGQLRPWTVVRCAPQLHVLVEGRMRSPGMLASGEFERAMLELREQHDVVVVHAPPQERGSDLPTLRGLAQGVLLAPAKGAATLEFGDAALRQLG
jgi:Mrp family chromosome partitioning ATPase